MMKNLNLNARFIVLIISILTLCIFKETEAPAAERGAQGMVAPAKGMNEAWGNLWKKTVEAAKKEGLVSVYAQWGSTARAELIKAFKEKFGITVEFTAVGKGSELVTKLDVERRGGLYLADVIGAGAPSILGGMDPKGIIAPLEPMLILPEVKDPELRLGNRIFLDQGKKLVPLSAEFLTFVWRNTKLAKEGEIKSYYDFLDPKWKGKILLHDPTVAGEGNAWISLMARLWGLKKLKDYLQQLANQEPVILRDLHQQGEWLARGKYPIGAGLSSPALAEMQKMGAPVARVRVKEGGLVIAGAGCIALPAGQLPHPNAAKVFINWLMTKEGQTLFSKGIFQPSSRIDVSTKGFEDALRLPGEPFVVEDEEGVRSKVQLMKISKGIFAPLMR